MVNAGDILQQMPDFDISFADSSTQSWPAFWPFARLGNDTWVPRLIILVSLDYSFKIGCT
jgi:hypothetical protein